MQQIGFITINNTDYKCLIRYHKEYVSLKLAKGKIDKEKMHCMTDECDFLNLPEAKKYVDSFLQGKVISI